MNQAEKEHKIIADSVYVKVWMGLVVLTAITVGVSYLDMQKFTVFTALLIATIKASLVLLYFMHIRYEKRIYAIMIMVVLVTYAIFIILTFTDYPFRQ
jgi:cytochrome c oxidase subunit 4